MTALVIGAGPAGLMAAEQLALAGLPVVIADQMPSPARKFLMAGKSGLNLTHVGPDFLAAYGPLAPQLERALGDFGPERTMAWAEGLGQPVFVGSSGRVFPRSMKASPLLRAWLQRLDGLGAELRRNWRWTGVDAVFDTKQGVVALDPKVTVLAMGGASWRRLGSDGKWAAHVDDVAPFQPANAGLRVDWSPHMKAHFGTPLKGIALAAGGIHSRGEIVLSSAGIEGGGIYPLTPALREGAPFTIDLMPDHSVQQVRARLDKAGRKASFSNRLRKAGLTAAKTALIAEFARSAPDMAAAIKQLPVPYVGVAPMDEAISTAGGLRFSALSDDFMLKQRPGVFACGEMLDWEAPTGGYLLTACLATGFAAGAAAAAYALK